MTNLRQSNNIQNLIRFCLLPDGFWRSFIFALIFGAFFLINISIASATTEDLKNGLQSELDQIQAQINDYKAKIAQTQNQSKTLKNEIQLLSDRAKAIELEIKQTELVLRQTQMGINEKASDIKTQQKKMEREKILLARYLRGIYESDQEGFIQLIFSQDKLSDVFNEINSLEVIQEKTHDTILQIKIIKSDLEIEKEDLTQKQEEEMRLKSLQTAQRGALKSQQSQKNNLLTQTKGLEAEFQKLLKKATISATEIRKQIYLLEGVGLSMSLEEAYRHAKYAADLTGVRPAFLMAVLKQESSWGTNVGKGTWKKDMRPADQKAFIQICDELNLDPNQMPVSKKPSYGWGGAMGPAQFLPTTWLGYKEEVSRVTGHNPPSPWDIDDAFTASAIKLGRDGANQRTSEAEWKAAMIYFAGSNWNKKVYSFYGDSVMELARVIQEQLDIINR